MLLLMFAQGSCQPSAFGENAGGAADNGAVAHPATGEPATLRNEAVAETAVARDDAPGAVEDKAGAPEACKCISGENDPVAQGVLEVIDVLRQQNLLPAQDDDGEFRFRVMRSVVRQIGGGADLLPASGSAGSDNNPALPPVGRTATLRGSFFYVQLGTVTPQAVKDFQEKTKTSGTDLISGVVVDLRYAAGGTVEAAEAMCQVMAGLGMPLVLLINQETSGAAESLVAMSRKKCDAVTVGQPTSGHPAAWYKKRLSTGETLVLPQMGPDESVSLTSLVPKEPDIPVNQVLSSDKLCQGGPPEDSAEANDACLRIAMDVLSAIRALENRKF